MQKSAYSVLVVLLLMWLVRIVDAVIPYDFNRFGLLPRTLRGLIGIPLSPFLHGGFRHLIANSVPLTVLLLLMVGSRHRPWPVVAAIALGGGGLLWIVGRPSIHVGASGLIFGLITYLIIVGIREREVVSLAVTVLVGLMFGSTLLIGVLPALGSAVSWEGHLCGALAGLAIGMMTTATAS